MPGRGDGHEILLEFTVRGAFVKVTAIDSVTGLEATISGPASAPRAALEAAVMNKLNYLRKKKDGEA